MKPYPITLITGFLGAGKTTLLNHLLSLPGFRDKKLALIINEFGDIGLDGKRLAQAGSTKGEVFELNRGSLFCICIKTDFLKTLWKICDEVKPDEVMIEATGISETGDIMRIVDDPSLTGAFRVRANLCLVDATGFLKVLPMLEAARSQAVLADGLVINKADLVPEKELEVLRDVLQELNPEAPLTRSVRGRISEQFLNSLTHERRECNVIKKAPEDVFSLSFCPEKRVDREMFYHCLSEYKEQILRLKGYVDFGDGTVFVEVAGGEIAEEMNNDKNDCSSLVVIGWRTDKEAMKKQFESCWY